MGALNKNRAIILIVVFGVLAAGVYLLVSLSQNRQGKGVQEKEQQAQKSQVFSAQGEVTKINLQTKSLTIVNVKEQTKLVIKLGEGTQIVKLIFPFDINNPPPDAVFAPERKRITLRELKKRDNVFVHSSHPIEQGQDIVNPTEIQVLP